ncbi:hypothetical protein AB9K21_00360 [Anaplasma phagocytophilum]
MFLRNYNTLAGATNATSSNCYSMDLSVVFGCFLLHLLGIVHMPFMGEHVFVVIDSVSYA